MHAARQREFWYRDINGCYPAGMDMLLSMPICMSVLCLLPKSVSSRHRPADDVNPVYI